MSDISSLMQQRDKRGNKLIKLIIFTDLDGSLLNHDDYAFDGALPSIQRIKKLEIPLIIVTSKTRREVEQLQGLMRLDNPFIVENGGGIFFPSGYRGFRIRKGRSNSGYTMIRQGVSYIRIRRFFETIKHKFSAMGFGDLSVDDIARLTGLSREQAVLTKIREFTEPFIIEREEDIPLLAAEAAEQGMKITRGGRFYHLIGKDQDKGAAVRMAYEVFHENTGKKPLSAGIGDSENDLPMLENVKIPVLIPHPIRGYLDIQLPGLIRAERPGCKGWNDVVWRLLDEIKTDD